MLDKAGGGWNSCKIGSGSGASFADGEALTLAPRTAVLIFDGRYGEEGMAKLVESLDRPSRVVADDAVFSLLRAGRR